MARWTWCALLAGLAAPAFAAETAVSTGGAEQYKLRVTLASDGEWPTNGTAEILFDEGSGAVYALVFAATETRFVLRRGGEERVIARDRAHLPIAAAPLSLVFARETWRKRLMVNGEVWLTAFDDTLPAGDVVLRSEHEKLSFGTASVQPTEPVFFTDDFMREEGDAGSWQPQAGKWALSGVSAEDTNHKGGPDAALSSNPFAFRATEANQGALAVNGYWFWDAYELAASFRAAGRDGAVGLCFYLADPSNYLAFRWHHAGGGGERRLVAVRDGREEILAVADGGWADEQWYRLGIVVIDGRIEASIDGQTVLTADSDLFGGGQIALWAEGVAFADFDDIRAAGAEKVIDSFGHAANGLWQTVRGVWETDPRADGPRGRGVIQPGGDGYAEMVTGDASWRDYRVTATVRLGEGSGVGLVTSWQRPEDYLVYRLGTARAPAKFANQVARSIDGVEELIVGDQRIIGANVWHEVAIESRNGFIRTFVDGTAVWEATDLELSRGKPGIVGFGACEIDQVEVDFVEPDKPVEFTERFTEEQSMHEWAAAEGSWYVKQTSQRGGVIWHRGDFFGDPYVAIDAALFGGEARSIRLVLDGDGQQGLSGHSLVLVKERADAPFVRAQIQIGGRPVAEGVAKLGDLAVIKFVRRGWFLMAYADDEAFVTFRTDASTFQRGLCAGIAGTGPEIDLTRVNAWSTNLFDTTFVQAPWEWRIAKGRWETINRWKCDPRWSFFGGWDEDDRLRPEHPLIWTKDDYLGDIRLEAYMAIRMDNPDGPDFYEHPSDLCLAVCGDGKEVTSGYTFVFAGRRNTKSMLYRQGRQIAESNAPAATFRYTGPRGRGLEEFHRHWFHVVLVKRGGRLICSVDDEVVFDVTDPAPLNGGKVGIYSINNGVMVARAKVWYAQTAPRQPFVDAAALLAQAEEPSDGQPFANDFERSVGSFRPDDPRSSVLLERTNDAGEGRAGLAITNLVTGGTFSVRAVDQRFSVAERPLLRFRYKIPPGVRINAYLYARGEWHCIALSGSSEVQPPMRSLGNLPVTADDRWHATSIDLRQAFGADVTVDRLIFGMLESDEYLHAGFGVNPLGATWHLDDFAVGQ